MDKDTYFVRALGCQWLGPEYDPRDPTARTKPTPYCGCKTLVGESVYCAEHYPRIYAKGTALRKRTKDKARADNIRLWESLFNEALEELESEGFDVYSRAIDEEIAVDG